MEKMLKCKEITTVEKRIIKNVQKKSFTRLQDKKNASLYPFLDFEGICGNKMPTRCNRGFLLQILLLAQHVSGTTMPIIRSSRVLHSGCCLWYLVLWFSSCRSGVELSILQTGHLTLSSTPDQLLEKPQHKIPHAATTV